MLPYAREIAQILESNYWVMRSVLALWFSAVIVLMIYFVPVGAGVVTAVFWPRKLPPFDRVMRNWTIGALKFWGLVAFCTALIYAMYKWEGSAEAILAVAIVLLPALILYIYRDSLHAGLITKLLALGVYITVLVYVFWQSPEFRIGCGAYAYFAASLASLYYIANKWRNKEFEHPKAIMISAIGAILLVPFIVVTAWVSNTIPSWEWPEWYQLLIYPEITLLAMIFIPVLYVQFWLPIRGNVRGY